MVAVLMLATTGCRENPGSGGENSKPLQQGNKKVVAATDQDAPPRVPGSHNSGMNKFKDPAVYLDGIPIGMLTFGEMPLPLPVTWYEEKAAVPFGPGHKGPKHRLVRRRRYRWEDYFKALGVDLATITEMHIYGGGRRAAAVIVKGEEISRDGFTFRFGADVWGKPLPACPPNFGDGKCPDQIKFVTLYSKREPPKREGGYFFLNGERVRDVPYYGEPLRGGVRVYLDGPLRAVIKRNRLVASAVEPEGAAGKERWNLFAVLREQGLDTDRIKEAWVIHRGRRVRRIERSELLTATFSAGQAGSGEILLGKGDIPTNALALHSVPLDPKDLPTLTENETFD
jgi:hypothetical protein